jgi:outer membrane protein assembly factor BamB
MNWTRRRVLTGAIGLGVATLAGCLGNDEASRALPESPSGRWYQAGHDAGNTCVSDVTVPARGTLAWEGGTAGTIQPVAAGETVFSVGDNLTALDAQTGDQRWQRDPGIESPGASVAGPAVTDEHVLAGVKGRLVAFAREDGTEEWALPVDGRPSGSVTVGPETQLGVVPVRRAGPGTDELLAFDPSTGRRRWTASLVVPPQAGSPAVTGDHVYGVGYTAEDRAVIRGFDAATGKPVWEHTLDDPETPPVATPEAVFAGDDGRLRRFSHAGGDGRVVFDPTGESGDIRGVAVAGATAFVLSNSGLAAVSAADGTREWSLDAEPRSGGICVGRETVVAPVSSDEFDLDTAWPCIAALDRATGAVRWYHPLDDAFDPVISTPPVIADGAVFYTGNTTSGVTALGDLPPE